MQKEARENADRIAEETLTMKNRFIDFRTKYKRLLESELQRFESLSGDIFPELGVDDFDDLPQPAQSTAAQGNQRPEPESGTIYYNSTESMQERQATVRNVRNPK